MLTARGAGGTDARAVSVSLDGEGAKSVAFEALPSTIAGGASLVAKAPEGGTLEIKDRIVSRGGAVHDLVPLTDAEMASADVPEYLRIRGYRIVALEA